MALPFRKYTKQIQWLARGGYASRALIYLAVGILGLLSALKMGGAYKETDAKGALHFFDTVPMSEVLVGLIAVGLFGFTLWRIIQSVFDADKHGDDAKGLLVRCALFISALTHGFLGWQAVNMIVRMSSSETFTEKRGVSWLLDKPLGEFFVILLGLVIFGYACTQFWKAHKEGFLKYLKFPARKSALVWISKIGLSARAATFVLISWFLIYAGWTNDASQVGGIKKVWSWLGDNPFGTLLVIAMALGLVSFALYSFIEARYRKINVSI